MGLRNIHEDLQVVKLWIQMMTQHEIVPVVDDRCYRDETKFNLPIFLVASELSSPHLMQDDKACTTPHTHLAMI